MSCISVVTHAASTWGILRDWAGYIRPFTRSVPISLLVPMVALKTVEYAIYKSRPRQITSTRRKTQLIYMITSRCTDRCPKCGIWKRPEPADSRVGVDAVLRAIKEVVRELGCVTITGGEPLLYSEEVLAVANLCKAERVPLAVVTNATQLTSAAVLGLDYPGNTIVVSLDTVSEQAWADFRGRNHFQQVMHNVRNAHNLLRFAELRVQTVLAQETVEHVAGVRAFCEQLQIAHQIQPYMDFGGSWNPTKDSCKGLPSSPCAAWRNICIYPNGDVVRCFDHTRIPEAKHPLGNITDQSLDAILCSRRSSVVTNLMKRCALPCKTLSCNRV